MSTFRLWLLGAVVAAVVCASGCFYEREGHRGHREWIEGYGGEFHGEGRHEEHEEHEEHEHEHGDEGHR